MTDYGYAQSEASWGDAYMSAADTESVMKGIKAVGGSRVRMGVKVGSWDDLDRGINLATKYGLKPLLCIMGNEQLVSTSQTNAAAYGSLCKMIAQRYGPSGSNQVAEYELFNEANETLNPPYVYSAAAFTDFLKSGYTAIKSVHSSSVVICGGTIPAPDVSIWFIGASINPVLWYQGIYAAGGKNYFDAAGFHLYADVFPTPNMTQWKYMTDLRALMVAQGDSAKQVWVTEVGTGNPQTNISDPTTERDWLKAMVEGIESYPWCGPFFIYNYRNSTNNLQDSVNASNYGIVFYDFSPKSPKYEYAATIHGMGTADTTPPDAPTGLLVSDITPTSATFTCNPTTDNVGVTDYRVYLNGVKSADSATTSATVDGLTPGTPYTAYMTALDAAGNESPASISEPFTTGASTGLQVFYQYNFTGTGSTLPLVFSQLGAGFSVTSDVALPNTGSTDGEFYLVAPYKTDQQSADHSSETAQATASDSVDRAALAVVRMTPSGDQWVAALIGGGGQADACQIITMIAGKVKIQDARNVSPLLPGEKLRLTAQGNNYTVARISTSNVATDIFTWSDTTGVYPGSGNLRTGIGWHYKRVSGVDYAAPGITGLWKASDLNPVTTSGSGGSDAWTFAVTNPSDLGLVYATGLWEPFLH